MTKDNVIKEDSIAKFYQYLNDMDYLRASEIIGTLKVFGEKTDVHEVVLFRPLYGLLHQHHLHRLVRY